MVFRWQWSSRREIWSYCHAACPKHLFSPSMPNPSARQHSTEYPYHYSPNTLPLEQLHSWFAAPTPVGLQTALHQKIFDIIPYSFGIHDHTVPVLQNTRHLFYSILSVLWIGLIHKHHTVEPCGIHRRVILHLIQCVHQHIRTSVYMDEICGQIIRMVIGRSKYVVHSFFYLGIAFYIDLSFSCQPQNWR